MGLGQTIQNAAASIGRGYSNTSAAQTAHPQTEFVLPKGVAYNFMVRAIDNGYIFSSGREGYYKDVEVFCSTPEEIAQQVIKCMVVAKLEKK